MGELISMNSVILNIFRWIGLILGILFLAAWCLVGGRYIPLLVLATILGVYLANAFGKSTARPGYLWIAFWVVLVLFPLDISFRHFSKHPRIVRYLVGMPTLAATEKAQRGELICAGCNSVLIEPSWVFVWRKSMPSKGVSP